MSAAVDPRNVLQAELLSDVLLEKAPESFCALVKVLTDFMQVTVPEVQAPVSAVWEMWKQGSPEMAKQLWEEVIGQIAGVVAEAAPAEEEEEAKEGITASDQAVAKYTPEEVALYMGAPLDSVYRWIDEGRFVGIRWKSNSKQLLIPETTYFITSGNTLELVSTAVECYHRQYREMGVRLDMTDEEYLEIVRKCIHMYEEFYGGTYEETLGAKKELTPPEESDAEIWLYTIQEEAELREK